MRRSVLAQLVLSVANNAPLWEPGCDLSLRISSTRNLPSQKRSCQLWAAKRTSLIANSDYYSNTYLKFFMKSLSEKVIWILWKGLWNYARGKSKWISKAALNRFSQFIKKNYLSSKYLFYFRKSQLKKINKSMLHLSLNINNNNELP